MKQLWETADWEAEVFASDAPPEDVWSDEEALQAEVWNTLEALPESELQELPALELFLDLEDGTRLAYQVAGVFACGEQEYMVLSPKSDSSGELSIMKLSQGEDDEIKLLPVEEEDWQAVQERFFELYGEDAAGE